MVVVNAALAQLSVNLDMKQSQFLAGEAVMAVARVSNQSGHTLHLSKEQEWLTFVVEAKGGLPIAKVGRIQASDDISLESSQVARVGIDISPHFDLTRLGQYSIIAVVKLPQWEQQFSSQPESFSVIRGTTLWEQEFGVPPSPLAKLTTEPPEVRKYLLLQANYLKHLQLYVRVTDARGDKIYQTYPLGLLVSFSRPEAQVDKHSNLHVLNQNGARTFFYCIINPDGRLVVRETYEYSNTRPRLGADAEGLVKVRGGARRISSNDLPGGVDGSPTNSAVAPLK